MTTPLAARDVARVDTPGIRGGFPDAQRVRPFVELLRQRLGHLGGRRRRMLMTLLQVARQQVGQNFLGKNLLTQLLCQR